MNTGLTYTSTLRIEDRHLACNVGSGDLPVLGTPVMLTLMENAAMMAVAPELEATSTTVGSHIASSHIKATGKGHLISATAELIEVEGRKLTFKVSASDEDGLIGEGEHIRYIVDRERFIQKVSTR